MSANDDEQGPQGWDEWGYPSPWGGLGTEPAPEQLGWEDLGVTTGESPGADLDALAELEGFDTDPTGGAEPAGDAAPEEGMVPEAEEELAEGEHADDGSWAPATAPEAAVETEDFDVEMLEAGGEGTGAVPRGADAMEAGSAGFPSGIVLPVRPGSWPPQSEHWDPHDTGLPLLEIPPALHHRKLAPSFTVKELATSGGRTAELARISPQLVRLLQAVRDRVGRPVTVTSGYRSWARNVAIYRARNATPTRSRHCSGQAADLKVRGLSGLQLAQTALDAGGPELAVGMGVGRDYLHLDVRGSWVLWTYLGPVADIAAKTAITAYRARAKAGGTPGGAAATRAPSAGVLTSTPDRLAGRVAYQRARSCLKSPQPGARACAGQWTRLTGRRAGILNCRPIRNDPANGWSVHSEGRAVDAYADADIPQQRVQAEAYVAWLQANAVELQCTYLIWNERQWSWGRRAQGWRPYRPSRRTKTTLHRDHVHIELTWEGSTHPSPLWEQQVPGWPT